MLPYRKMLVEIMAKVKTCAIRQVAQGRAGDEPHQPYDDVTLGDVQSSKDRFITEVYNEVAPSGLPPVVDGRRKCRPHFKKKQAVADRLPSCAALSDTALREAIRCRAMQACA